jgi:integrase
MAGKRRFGRVRQLPSGRWQARYKGPDGIDRPASHTFESKASADRWLALQEAEIIRGDWIDPEAGRVNFGGYATTWIEERPGLRPKTIELYRYLLRGHLEPTFGTMLVADIHEPHIRHWRKERLDAGVSAVTIAKAYRLLKAIMNTAADDGLIRRNPCRIKGASVEKSPERPVLTVRQVFDLAEAVGVRYRTLILLAVFAGLRWGELAALRRCDVDPEGGTVRVFRQLAEQRGGGFTVGPPKSDAGKRVVVIPDVIMPAVRQHMSRVTQPGEETLVFATPTGAPLRHSNFRQRVWLPALRQAGLPLIHFHDLRHTGNVLAANAGAGLRELMDRLGHSTTRAALIYLHGSDEQQRAVAEALSQLTTDALNPRPAGRSGTQRARKRRPAS